MDSTLKCDLEQALRILLSLQILLPLCLQSALVTPLFSGAPARGKTGPPAHLDKLMLDNK
jgi:hypothetical protein